MENKLVLKNRKIIHFDISSYLIYDELVDVITVDLKKYPFNEAIGIYSILCKLFPKMIIIDKTTNLKNYLK